MERSAPNGYPILVVDDDQVYGHLLEEARSCHGFLVKLVQRGQLACQLAYEQRFSLIIADMQMKPVSGLELLKWFQRRFPRLPVILIAAFGSPHTRVYMMQHGAFHYLDKPIDLEELFLAVDQALRHFSPPSFDPALEHTEHGSLT